MACAVIECVCHRSEDLIVFRIEIVKNGLGKLVLHCELVEELVSCSSTSDIMDGIIACVRSKNVEHSRIIVADCSYMELLCPSLLVVHTCKVEKDSALELENFLIGRTLSFEGISEDLVDFLHFEIFSIEVLETMVGNPASHLVEEVMALSQSIKEVLIAADLHSSRPSELLYILLILFWLFNYHRLVRPPCRKDFCSERIVLNLLVVFQCVCRVVSGTYDSDIEFSHEGLSSELLCRELCSTFIIYCAGCPGAQQVVYSENPCKFKVGPVI